MLKTTIDVTPHFVGGVMHGHLVPAELVDKLGILVYGSDGEVVQAYAKTQYYQPHNRTFDFFVAIGASLEESVRYIYGELQGSRR